MPAQSFTDQRYSGAARPTSPPALVALLVCRPNPTSRTGSFTTIKTPAELPSDARPLANRCATEAVCHHGVANLQERTISKRRGIAGHRHRPNDALASGKSISLRQAKPGSVGQEVPKYRLESCVRSPADGIPARPTRSRQAGSESCTASETTGRPPLASQVARD